MVTIAVSRAWTISTLKQHSWMSHVLIVGTWPSRCCGPDTSSSNEGISPSPSPILVPLSLWVLLRAWSGWSEDHSESFPVECFSVGLSFLQHNTPSDVFGWTLWILGQDGAQHLVRSASRWQDVDHIIGGQARLWRWWFGCAASVRKCDVVWVRSRADCYALPGCRERRAALEASSFSQALKARRLVHGGADRSPAATSSSILGVHEEVTRSWRVPVYCTVLCTCTMLD